MQRTKTDAGVMDVLAEYINTNGMAAHTQVLDSLRALVQNSTDAQQPLSEILTNMVTELQGSVSPLILAGHAATQDEVNRRISDLDAATEIAVAQKTIADQADEAWFECVGDEKAKRTSVEDADAASAQAKRDEEESCRQQDEKRSFSAELTHPVFEECDVSLQGDCGAQVESYESQLNGMSESLQHDFAEKQASYNAAKAVCEAASLDVVSKQSALEAANAAWSSQKDLCVQKHESRTINMCLFGADLQAKCEKVAAYESLLADIDATGTEYSHSDRLGEWTTVEHTICLMEGVIAGGLIDEPAIGECDKAVDYEGDVGTVDRHTSRFKDLTTAEMFTCSESTISFVGETWEVLPDALPLSSGYTTKPYAPEVSLTASSAPFSFCASSGLSKPCGWKSLGRGWCREPDGNKGSFTIYTGETEESCQAKCCADPACVAVEFYHGNADGKCELHDRPVDHIVAHPDGHCLVKQ